MSQEIRNEVKKLLSVTNLHTAYLFLIKKYGPEAYAEQQDQLLNNLAMLNPNFGLDRVMLFTRLMDTILSTLPKAEQWFIDNDITGIVHEHFAELEAMQEEVNKLLMPTPLNISIT